MSLQKVYDTHKKYSMELYNWLLSNMSRFPGDSQQLADAIKQYADCFGDFEQVSNDKDFSARFKAAHTALQTSMAQYAKTLDPKSKVSKSILKNFTKISADIKKAEHLSDQIKLGRVGELFKTIMDDTRDASPSYNAVRNSLLEFCALDQDKTAEDEYRRKLSKAIDCAGAYLRDHRKSPHSKKGIERVASIKELHTLLTNRQTEIEAARNSVNDKNIADQQQVVGSIIDSKGIHASEIDEEVLKLARLQANISPSKMIAKQNDFVPKPSNEMLSSGKKKHQAFSVLYATAGTVLGGATYILGAPFHANFKKPVIQPLSKNHIPGYSKDTFFKDINPDEEPDGQDLITDVRRIPLVYETMIPEDPNQGPTISLNICQDVEGETRSVVYGKDANGEKGAQMGHGFVSLCYSKKDPLSGQLRRYKTTFGFYPKGGFVGPNHQAAMLMEGRHIPGQIVNDDGHAFSISETHPITNKQFNKIILAAQNYADEGYNYVARNCSTFVHDMAELAGVDVSKTFHQADLTSNFMGAPLTFFGTFGGKIMHKFSDNDYKNKAGKNDLDYSRFGHKMVTDNEMKLLEKDQFNMRLIGYSPSHVASSMRTM